MTLSNFLRKFPEARNVYCNIGFLARAIILSKEKFSFSNLKPNRDYKVPIVENLLEIGPVIFEL